MLVKGNYIKFPLIYWILVISVFLGISYRTLFIDVQIQNYYFNDLEDFGRYVFYLGLSFAEAFLYILILRIVIGISKLFYKKLITIQNKVPK